MPQPIQLKRRTDAPGPPATLLPGEVVYNSDGHQLFVGDGNTVVHALVSASRQVELAGNQTLTPGAKKTIAIDDLKVTGGGAGDLVSTDGTGNLNFLPLKPATNPEMDAGTRNDAYGTPLNIRSLVGASVASLSTVAKQLVPAINEIKAALDLQAKSSELAGSFQADASTITWTAESGASGNSLPAPSVANTGWYLIADKAGSQPPIGAPAEAYEKGDWLISNGTIWMHLKYGGISNLTAGAIPVNPTVLGGDDVQEVLQLLAANIGVYIGVNAPPTPFNGMLWYELDTEILHLYYTGGGSPIWITIGDSSGGGTGATVATDLVSIGGTGAALSPITLLMADGNAAKVITRHSDVANTAPDPLALGELGVETVAPQKLWVGIAGNAKKLLLDSSRPIGAVISEAAPANPLPGMLWWASGTGVLWLYYSDANSSQWVEAAGKSGAAALADELAQARVREESLIARIEALEAKL